MPRKSVVCQECGASVLNGRLACPSCGALVAAVAGSASRRPARPPAEEQVVARNDGAGSPPGLADEPSDPPAFLARAATPATPGAIVAPAASPSTPPIIGDWPPRVPRSMEEPTGRQLSDAQGGRTSWREELGEVPTAQGRGLPPGYEPAPPAGNGSVSGAYVPPSTTWPTPTPSPVPALDDGIRSEGYMEPSGVFSPTPAAATVGPGARASTAGAGSPAGVAGAAIPGSASLLADLPFDAPNTLSGWLLALGAGAASVGFVLPWSSVIIGAASSGGGYLETWGLATPSHLVILLITAAGFLMAVVPNRVPVWLRTGVLGMIVGGVLVGMAWPYLFDGLGYQVGIVAELVGAALLIVAAVLSMLPARHDRDEPSV